MSSQPIARVSQKRRSATLAARPGDGTTDVAAVEAGGMVCAVCGGAPRPDRHAWLRRCAACGVLSADFPVAIATEHDEALIDEGQREVGLASLRTHNNQRLLGALTTLAARGARLLDVGCGPGFLLRQAQDYGFAAEGVEPDANVVAAAGAAGPRVRHGFFPDVLTPDDLFDVIVFNDVLEHIPDLAGALQASWRHLAAGGVLCLNCPNRDGLFFRTATILDRLGLHGPYDRLWQRGLASPHVWYLTPDNLRLAAARQGFEAVSDVRLETVELSGLWQRIRCVRGQPLPLSIAAFLFSVAMAPLARLMPSDAVACFFRKAA